ncbi:MAG: VWA domain-containing protein [Planctomycetes bacterium]|nr:VWA domain-containing protein [Planctomycetota bacterium]
MSTNWFPELVVAEDPAHEPIGEAETLASPREVPAWAASLVVHLVILLVLGTVMNTTILRENTEIDSAMVEDELDPEAFKFDTTVRDELGSDSELNVVSASKAAATYTSANVQEQIERPLMEEVSIELPTVEAPPQPSQDLFTEVISTNGATEHVGGVSGAMDRLAFEIANSLRDRKTLVIWLMDASGSMEERRQAVADRFENVYRQLGLIGDIDSQRSLKTAVASFSNVTRLLTEEPVDDYRVAAAAVRNIKSDMETTHEFVLQAVNLVADKWKSFRTRAPRRNVMVIIVTDEKGDDFARGNDFTPLELTINKLARLGMRVYCVGNAAVFGKEKGYVTWKYEDGDTVEVPVDQGPESLLPDQLELGFWGGGARELERMTAGFGPYALTRLCRETGGLYLISAESEQGPRFEMSVMRNYQPDYSSARKILEAVQGNKAKAALVDAATNSKAINIPNPQTVFNAPNDNVLRQEINEAQKPMANIDYFLKPMQDLLEMGEKDRAKLEDARWQAAYDLAMGRILAMRVRAYGYNVVLADMKATPKAFQNKDSNQWRLVPSREVDANAAVRKMEKEAREYLSRVVDEHPGTPWAKIAERELTTSMGWEWKEGRTAASRMQEGRDPDEPMLQLAEEEQRRRREEMKRKQARPLPKL